MAIGMLLIVPLLVVQFNSIRRTAMVLLTILGVILAGIVINNAIVLIQQLHCAK